MGDGGIPWHNGAVKFLLIGALLVALMRWLRRRSEAAN